MGVATRDYIPQDEGMTAREVSNSQRGRMIRTGANHQDFIPDPDDPTPAPKATMDPVERADRAQEFANQRALAGERQDWLVAVERLKNWTIPQAIEAMQGMPFRMMELYLTVERHYAQRADILRLFGAPDPRLAEVFERLLAAEPVSGNADPATEVAESPEIETSILGVADLGESAPEEEVVAAQTYDCFDCDFQGKTLAGLKAHERAKHGIGDDADDVPTTPQAGE
jgi:hypothetical protein